MCLRLVIYITPVPSEMECRPHSEPEKGKQYYLNRRSEDVGPDDDTQYCFPLKKYLAKHAATKVWVGPRYPAYNHKAARLRSYTEWPHGMNPSPSSLSTAGFYYTGKRK